MFNPEIAAGTLRVLARYQGTKVDDLARGAAGQDPA